MDTDNTGCLTLDDFRSFLQSTMESATDADVIDMFVAGLDVQSKSPNYFTNPSFRTEIYLETVVGLLARSRFYTRHLGHVLLPTANALTEYETDEVFATLSSEWSANLEVVVVDQMNLLRNVAIPGGKGGSVCACARAGACVCVLIVGACFQSRQGTVPKYQQPTTPPPHTPNFAAARGLLVEQRDRLIQDLSLKLNPHRAIRAFRELLSTVASLQAFAQYLTGEV